MAFLHWSTRYSISAPGGLLIKHSLTVRLPLWTMITLVSSSSVGMDRCALFYTSCIFLIHCTHAFFFWHYYWDNTCRDVFTQLVWTLTQEHYPVLIAIEVMAGANLQSRLCSTEVFPCLPVALCCWHVLKMEVCLFSGLVIWFMPFTFKATFGYGYCNEIPILPWPSFGAWAWRSQSSWYGNSVNQILG